MKRMKLNDAESFFNILDENREIAGDIVRNIGKMVKAQERINHFLLNGPTAEEKRRNITIDDLHWLLQKSEKRFLSQMITLSNENGGFLDRTYVEEAETLAVEVITILMTLKLTDAVFGIGA